uniref:Uncharacterized protein n=1 Tax=Setaria viridis TaxID=4556 RepID=A0A4U6TJH6_SETVI|nr:hypothetical protein SEVIR_8G252200v2 [Setaria viridis]
MPMITGMLIVLGDKSWLPVREGLVLLRQNRSCFLAVGASSASSSTVLASSASSFGRGGGDGPGIGRRQ